MVCVNELNKAAIAVAWLLAGCASGQAGRVHAAGVPAPGEPVDTVEVEENEDSGAGGKATPSRGPTGDLTLEQALSAALAGSPELEGYSWEVRAKEAEALQAGLYYNPTLELEVEEFAGGGALAGFKAAQTTLRLGQYIDIGGEFSGTREVARLGTSVAEWNYRLEKLEVFTSTTKAFVDVVSAQERVRLARDSLRLAREVFEAAKARVSAGKVSPLEEDKARVALVQAEVELMKALGELSSARARLSTCWGETESGFTRALGVLDVKPGVPSLDEVLSLAGTSPAVKMADARIRRLRAQVDLEEAKAVPGLEISAGATRLEEVGEFAAVLGLGLELPVFDRNQGGVRKARRLLSKGLAEKRATLVKVKAALIDVYNKVSAQAGALKALDEEIVPSAARVFEAARKAYALGKLGLLDLVDAQRILVNVKSDLVDALAAYHKSVAEIEGILGRPVAEALNETEVER